MTRKAGRFDCPDIILTIAIGFGGYSWCRPCKMLAPVLEAAVAEHNGSILLAKMNADENRAVNVNALPTVFGYSKGQPVNGFVGGQPSSKIKEFLNELQEKHKKQ